MPEPTRGNSNGHHGASASRMRIAVVQYDMRPIQGFADFEKQCAFFVNSAAAYSTDIILFPELFTTQLLSCIQADSLMEATHKLADMTPQYVELFQNLARTNKMNIVAGTQLSREDNQLFNISYFFHRDGRYEKQYKVHITPVEKKAWDVAAGHTVEVFDTDCGKIAVLICYDIEFPELSRIAASKGARVIFVPSNTDQRSGYLRVRYCAQARCIENHVYVAVSGCVGNTPMLNSGEIHYSQGAVFTPSDIGFSQDAVAAECQPNVETMIIQDLDLDFLEHHKQTGSVRPWNDRRLDLYRVDYTEGKEKLSV